MSDVNAAAERVRRVCESGDIAGVYRQFDEPHLQHMVDYGVLAKAYLALHPADDGDAIDEAWLRSNYSFTNDGDDWLVTIRHAPDTYTELRRNRSGVWQLGSGNARHMSFIELHKQPKTRCDFRRLLAAIG